MRRIHSLLLLVVACLILETPARCQEAKIPKLLRRVTDFTNTLSSGERDALEGDLARFEDSTSTQLTVVVIPTLGGLSIEEFALRTAEVNGIGQKKRDNGVLLLIAKDDRKIRIEVGYGLEGVLPDALCGQIIRREITPFFRSGDYYSGVKAGVEAIMQASRNEYKADKKSSEDGGAVPLVFLLFFLFMMISVMRRARRGKGISRAGSLPIFYGGGWGGGSHSSGGGGFGGFSGGGGSFGGGGASGSW